MNRRIWILLATAFLTLFLAGCDLFATTTATPTTSATTDLTTTITTTTTATTTTTTATTTTATTTTATTTTATTTTATIMTTVPTTTTATTTTTIMTTVPTTTTATTTTVTSFTVSFYDDDAVTFLGSVVVMHGNDATAPVAPVKTASAEYTYTFSGWSQSLVDVQSNMTVYAVYDAAPRAYTIHFDEKDGSPVADITLDYGSVLTAPAAPVKTGFSFGGWYTEDTFVNLYAFGTMPAETITLFAKWNPPAFTIHFVTNGGTLIGDVSGPSGTTFTSSVTTKTGYEFAGWYADAGLSLYFGEAIASIPDGDLTLYADWSTAGLNYTPTGDDFIVDIGTATAVDIVIPVRHAGKLVVSVKANGFQNSGIHAVDLPEGLTGIGTYAFDHCTSLTAINFPSTLIMLGDYAFQGDTALVVVVLPDGVTTMGYYAFGGCTALSDVTLSAGLTQISNGAFENCTSLAAIAFPAGIEKIRGDAFSGCSALLSLTIPGTMHEIESRAFYHCTSLATVVINEGMGRIWTQVFEGCSALTSVTLPHSVTEIDRYAFADCMILTSIVIHATVTEMEDAVFFNCPALTIYCEATGKPLLWYSSWNVSNCPVVWGYGG